MAILLTGTAPLHAADLLELRGTTKGAERGLDEAFAQPPVGRIDDRVVLEDEGPAPLSRSTQTFGPLRQGSSILRIGPAPGSVERIADGRVDRPAPRPNSAGQLPGGDPEGGLVVVRQDVRDLIEQVARFYGFDTALTRQVRGDVQNTTLPSDFNAFLERLSDTRDLVFYFRNRELNASTREENVNRVIGLGPSNPAELRAAVEAAGVDADRFPLRFIEASNSVLVDGPPSFVALVEVIAESLVRTERPTSEITVIRGNTIERATPGGRTVPAPAPASGVPSGVQSGSDGADTDSP